MELIFFIIVLITCILIIISYIKIDYNVHCDMVSGIGIRVIDFKEFKKKMKDKNVWEWNSNFQYSLFRYNYSEGMYIGKESKYHA